MRRLRIYIDTSVVGGCLEAEFVQESIALFDMARRNEATILISDLLTEELVRAPREVQAILPSLPNEVVERIYRTPESLRLGNAYIEAEVVSPQSDSDANHVALATVTRADVIVSWNFKHIVHFDKIRLFNAVNLREGYPLIDIRSPKEIV